MTPLMGGLLVAPLAAIPLAMGLVSAAKWHVEGSRWSDLETIGASAACWIMGALLGLVVMALVSGMEARKLAMGMLASSMVRAGVALFDGLALNLVFKPEAKTFWSAFLLCGLGCLIVETVWSIRSVHRAGVTLQGGSNHAGAPAAAETPGHTA